MQEIVEKQNQKTVRNFPVLVTSKDYNCLPIQDNPIQGAIQLCTTLSEKETVVVYQEAAGKTWVLLKQAFFVIFLLSRLLIALIIWVCGIAFQSIQHFWNWLEVKKPTIRQILSKLGKILSQALVYVYEWAASLIKEDFGWEVNFDACCKPETPPTETQETTDSVAVSPNNSQ